MKTLADGARCRQALPEQGPPILHRQLTHQCQADDTNNYYPSVELMTKLQDKNTFTTLATVETTSTTETTSVEGEGVVATTSAIVLNSTCHRNNFSGRWRCRINFNRNHNYKRCYTSASSTASQQATRNQKEKLSERVAVSISVGKIRQS